MVVAPNPEILELAVSLLTPGSERASAVKAIEQILSDYEIRARSSLTWAEISKELEAIGRKAEYFKSDWKNLSPVSRSRISWTTSLEERFDRLSEDLEKLTRVAEAQAAEIKETRKEHDLKGRAGSYPEPDHQMVAFVRDCLRVFEEFRPGTASATTAGPFREFVSTVHELRTGEAGIDLERRVRSVIRQWRETQNEQTSDRQSVSELIAEMNRLRGRKRAD